MQKKLFTIGGIFALLAVVLGALGAHALKKALDAESLASFETAVKFMFYHALALLILGLAAEKLGGKLFNIAANLIISGTCLFSGSIYILSTKSLLGLDLPKIVGLITPLGGVLLIAGWAIFILTVFKQSK